MPFVSVIVPVYKVEKYLNRCVDSILSQTFTDFELILVDDGSPDNCGKICDAYANKDSRVIVVHQINMGVSVARNSGARVAKGCYVTFVDSDDCISPFYLEYLCVACQKSGASIACCNCLVFNDIVSEKSVSPDYTLFDAESAMNYFGKEYVQNNKYYLRAPWAKLIKKELVLQTPFPTDRIYAEDAACVYLWIWNAGSVAVLDAEMYYYFQNPSSICHQSVDLHVLGNFQTEYEWLAFFKNHSMYELCKIFSREYFKGCVWAFNGAQRSNNIKARNKFRNCLRKGLIKYRRFAELDTKEIIYYHEIAYPKMMKLYWFLYGLRNHFKKEK